MDSDHVFEGLSFNRGRLAEMYISREIAYVKRRSYMRSPVEDLPFQDQDKPGTVTIGNTKDKKGYTAISSEAFFNRKVDNPGQATCWQPCKNTYFKFDYFQNDALGWKYAIDAEECDLSVSGLPHHANSFELDIFYMNLTETWITLWGWYE